ncbi:MULTISPECIES: elongation factor P 5-aminopentanone reductase [unclassified Sedimentibacter]|uniref:elongation factor P 5-aminopentanone reductase n=1 Tax=unclassified Sedimentibacter TaxID=2649220 RepID=UPI0027E0B555|nr:3-oxoacyl-ACP reductase FabG [Sedimentibacter sp. MB35-C1]WMJ76816.1 3-oxoacyl-ACP reductase FabG [Sedimentibacter sp. MB35-C1]
MLSSKTVIVTGASRGIGHSIAELFAHKEYNVLINYNHSKESAMHLYDKLKSEGLFVKTYKADVSNRYEVDLMTKFCIEEFGGLDILINNAGICQEKLFTDITDEDLDHMLNTNFKSAFYCSQSALKHMLPNKQGKIINISSIWGIVGASCEVHYSATKAAIIGFTKALAKELGPSNIQVNCIAPGVIQTEMLSSYNENELGELKEHTPLMRLGNPNDIAGCALYLASLYSNFVTGQVISPNGGFVI